MTVEKNVKIKRKKKEKGVGVRSKKKAKSIFIARRDLVHKEKVVKNMFIFIMTLSSSLINKPVSLP